MAREYLAILLPTYNSSLYLKQLINSIRDQTFINWHLFIRDDGSIDNTVDLLQEYAQLDERITILIDSHQHLGAKNCFFLMLNEIESEFYMFCDHDDVWLPDKISITLDKFLSLGLVDRFTPVIIHTDLVVVDKDLNILCPSFWKFSNIDPNNSNFFLYHCAYNNVTGCTMLINREAREIVRNPPSTASMHDAWISLAVSFHRGIITYVPIQTILYRQHENNTFGARKIPTIGNQLMNFRAILNRNRDQIKTINSLCKMSTVHFLYNKLYFNLKLRFRSYYR